MLSDKTKKTMNIMASAFAHDAVCAVEATDKTTNKPVVLVCVAWEKDGEHNLAPIAVMFGDDEDPYERYVPNIEGVRVVNDDGKEVTS